MPIITVTRDDYDEIIYPALAERHPASDEELELADAVIAKLEAVGTPEADEEGESVGGYVMTLDQADVDLTDEEAGVVYRRLQGELRRHDPRRLRSLIGAFATLRTAVEDTKVDRQVAELDARIAAKQDELRRAAIAVHEAATAREAEIEALVAERRAELQAVESELGTRRTELDGIVAEIEAQGGGAR